MRRSPLVPILLTLIGCDRPITMSTILADTPLVEADTTGLPGLGSEPLFLLTRDRLALDLRAVPGQAAQPVATASTATVAGANAYGGLAEVEALMRAHEGACEGGRVALGLAPDVPLVLAARVVYTMPVFCHPSGLDVVVASPPGLAALPMDLDGGSCVPDDPPRAALIAWVDTDGVRVQATSTGPSQLLLGLLNEGEAPEPAPPAPPWASRVLVASEGDCLSAARRDDGHVDVASVTRLISRFSGQTPIVGARIEGPVETTWADVADVAIALTREGVGFSAFAALPANVWTQGCEQVYVVRGP